MEGEGGWEGERGGPFDIDLKSIPRKKKKLRVLLRMYLGNGDVIHFLCRCRSLSPDDQK